MASTPSTERGQLLTVDELAATIRKPRGFVYREVRAGRIPALRLGQQLRFRPEDIDRWLSERVTSAVADGAR